MSINILDIKDTSADDDGALDNLIYLFKTNGVDFPEKTRVAHTDVMRQAQSWNERTQDSDGGYSYAAGGGGYVRMDFYEHPTFGWFAENFGKEIKMLSRKEQKEIIGSLPSNPGKFIQYEHGRLYVWE